MSTANANFQFISRSSVLAPIIRNMDDTIEAMACEMKVFTASTSEVRFVRSFSGVESSIYP